MSAWAEFPSMLDTIRFAALLRDYRWEVRAELLAELRGTVATPGNAAAVASYDAARVAAANTREDLLAMFARSGNEACEAAL